MSLDRIIYLRIVFMRLYGAHRFVLIALSAGALHAQTPERRWSLQELLDLTDQQSPTVLMVRLARDSALAEVRIAKAYANPQFTGIQNAPYQYGLAWQSDWGPLRRERIRSAQFGAEALTADAADIRRRMRAVVRTAFYDLLLAEAQRALVTDARDVYRQLMLADSTRLRTGSIAERTAVKSALEYARAEAGLVRASQLVRAERLQLQVALGLSQPDTAFRVDGSLDAPMARTAPPEGTVQPLAERPDVKAAAFRVNQAQAVERQARALLIPQLQFSLVTQHGPQRFEPDVPFTLGQGRVALGTSITLPVLTQYRGERERAAVAIRTAKLGERQITAAVSGEIQQALDAYRSATELLTRYRGGLLTAVDAALAQARYAYQAGAMPLLDLLDAVRTYQDTRSDWLMALHDYWIADVRLLRAGGEEPKKP